ncbi:ABC transporter ATP-binding protein [Salsipaludibacter albus]|uniref:ABC transporter ATP-binding protein n=1 Tax=Salsipaludibacter albus TaxID=2849650 RepID=UPI001EE41B0E|nr:ABC transporter ATP-binding protein [Salsipaludibacter albus]MBY5162902.1 ABC transporter ATP-binding protein [Salsipaludibacter albus]
MTDATAIVVRNLHRDFGSLRALNDVSFAVPRGSVVALLGHNGAGKTTLLRVLNGLLRPTAGQVLTLGMDPVVDGQAVRSRTGVLTEYPALDDFLTIRENMAAYGAMYGLTPDVADMRSGALLVSLGLGDRGDTPTRDLSAGLKQRAALARAMLHEPELLLLDEPTSNLDPLAARRVRELVAARSRDHGTTVVVSTHNLAEANAIADRVVVLEHGHVLANATVRELTRTGARPFVAITTDSDTHLRALEVVENLVGPVEPHRTPWTFSVPTHDHTTATLVSELVRAGVAVESVVPQTPSLEDVYVSLHHPASPAPSQALT